MKKIRELIDEFWDDDSDRLGYKDWCYDFVVFLKRMDFSDEEIEDIIRIIMDKRNLYNVDKIEKFRENCWCPNSKVDWNSENRQGFFEYLESISSKITRQYVLDGIEFAKRDLHINSNFIDAFIKYIVTTNFRDVYVESNILELKSGMTDWGSFFCKLGEFVLADLEVDIFFRDIRFDGLSTRSNLRSIKLGALLFRKVQRDVAHYFPGYDLYADNVKKENRGARRFYESMGAEVIEGKSGIYCTVLFPADRLQELSEIPVESPTLEYYTNLQIKQSIAIEIREYINRIMQMQKQYQAEGKGIPVSLRMPKQIEISPRNLEYLLENGIIVYEETEREVSFIFEKTEEYPELELRMKQNDKEKYVLTYIKGRMKEGEDVFIWDSKEKEGKKGILVISRDDDGLEDLVPMDDHDIEER